MSYHDHHDRLTTHLVKGDAAIVREAAEEAGVSVAQALREGLALRFPRLRPLVASYREAAYRLRAARRWGR